MRHLRSAAAPLLCTAGALAAACSSSSGAPGSPDAAFGVETGEPDGGTASQDSAAVDSGSADSTVLDSGAADSNRTDSGSVDSGVADSAADSATTRTVTGAYTTTFEKDDLSKLVVQQPPPTGEVIAALVAGSSGYTTFPGAFAPDGGFSIPDVPAGTYFLSLTTNGSPFLQVFSASLVTLSNSRAARPDLAYVTQPTPVTFNVTNLAPWVKNGFFEIASSQGGVNLRPFQLGGVAQPAAGATSFSSVVDWSKGAAGTLPAGLPDASKGDVVYVALGTKTAIGSGAAAATLKYVTQYARLTDLTVVDGTPSNENVPLSAAPLTGSASLDVRYSQFAALGPAVSPAAQPATFDAQVFASAYSVTFPDFPTGNGSAQLLQLIADVSNGTGTADGGAADGGPTFADYDYGTVAYGQFLGSLWVEYSDAVLGFNVSFSAAGASAAVWPASIEVVQSSVFASPIVPGVGPPLSPQVNGQNAFVPQTGATLTPTIAWQPPAVGTPTSYALQVVRLDNVAGATVFTPVLGAYLFATTSFRVPAGVLTTGATYFTVITANAAPWDVIDAPGGYGAPLDTADCVTGTFTP